jgi:hypothetical protein
MDTVTAQNNVQAVSDLLFFQQPGILYALVISMIATGAVLWVFGHPMHRMLLTMVFLGIGILVGWKVGMEYQINPLLAIPAGGAAGAAVGYWCFRFWLGILSACLIFFLMTSLYSWQIAVPYLSSAADEFAKQLRDKGIELSPGTNSLPLASNPSTIEPSISAPIGQAYKELQHLKPKLLRSNYKDWREWQDNFLPALKETWARLIIIIPHLSLNMILLAAISLIIAGVLAVLRPMFLNIAYTTLTGLLLIAGGIEILLTLKRTEYLDVIKENSLIALGVLSLVWLGGIVLQYSMIPPPPPPDEESEDATDPPEKSGGKKKK